MHLAGGALLRCCFCQLDSFYRLCARSGGGQAAGHQTLSYTKTLDSSQQPNLTLWEWDDNDFAAFNFRTASCGQIISPDHLTFSIPLTGHDGTVSNEFLENRAPHFWFFAIGAYPFCPPVGAEWTMTVTQEDGSQLSYDELGLPTIFAIFFVLFLGGFVAHVWAHYVQTPRFSPLLVILFSASLGAYLASTFFKLIRYGSISATGIDSLACAGLALAFHAAANVFILIVCGLAAVGYGVSSSRLFQVRRPSRLIQGWGACAMGAGRLPPPRLPSHCSSPTCCRCACFPPSSSSTWRAWAGS